MGILGNLKIEDKDIQNETDTLGGSRLFDSGIYDFLIEMAYLDTAKSGAISVNYTFKHSSGKTLFSTEYVTSGTAKGGKPFYLDRNKKKRYLPGFITANNIARVTNDCELSELEEEKRLIKVRGEMQERSVLKDLRGKKVSLGIIKQLVDKNVKDSEGNYVPSGETREENVIDKVFTTDHLTLTEYDAGHKEPDFANRWLEKNKGTVVNKAKGAKSTEDSSPPFNTEPSTTGGSLFDK